MHIKDEYVLRKVGDMGIIVPIDAKLKGESYALNHTAVAIWMLLKKNLELKDLVSEMAKIYDVPVQELEQDINEFLCQLRKIGLVED